MNVETHPQNELSGAQRLHVANLCRKRKLGEALAAYLYFALGDLKIKNVDAFLADPRYRDTINRAVFDVWAMFSPEYIPNKEFETLLQDVAAQEPITVAMVDVLYKEFSKPLSQSAVN